MLGGGEMGEGEKDKIGMGKGLVRVGARFWERVWESWRGLDRGG